MHQQRIAAAGATVERLTLELSRTECDVLRDAIALALENVTFGLDTLADIRPLIHWAIPLLDAIGWEAPSSRGANNVTVPADNFRAFLIEARQGAQEYLDHQIEQVEEMNSDSVASMAEVRQARHELESLTGILAIVASRAPATTELVTVGL